MNWFDWDQNFPTTPLVSWTDPTDSTQNIYKQPRSSNSLNYSPVISFKNYIIKSDKTVNVNNSISFIGNVMIIDGTNVNSQSINGLDSYNVILDGRFKLTNNLDYTTLNHYSISKKHYF